MIPFAIFAAACGLTSSIFPAAAPVLLAIQLPVLALALIAAVTIAGGNRPSA